jgi:hypothetical protein
VDCDNHSTYSFPAHGYRRLASQVVRRVGVALIFVEVWYNGITLGSDPIDGSSILSTSANFSIFFNHPKAIYPRQYCSLAWQ